MYGEIISVFSAKILVGILLNVVQVKGPQNVSCFLKFSVLSTHLEFFNFLFSFERNPANVYPKIAEGIRYKQRGTT